MQIKEDLIRKQRYFKDLELKHLQALALNAEESHWEAESYIFRIGESARHFYLIGEGSVSLEMHAAQRGMVRIQTLHAGDILGWSWLFPPYKWHFDARVLEPVRGLVFDAETFLDQCEIDHELGYQIQKRFSRMMVERLQATRLQLLDLYQTGEEK
ncbi:Crp/Fnr family transcriptional regulator [bacterium (Candidatus Blackallbacteria) CG17_big_fil_post_rev_8_21_14_2_50_48_46]|uniref:Crp/Fnr family transcriptional regulator n=1 Tax=bacterium (Candidatus Blackallbacteria) CG17_big_fil_post_rev_8_21_14_2_50_48_46 TaxID=2014261 RepID=A0A2M7FYM2_9BACT|nr:MAG: Crp/Fnr family transcriptional regulator [bacterium (Candidatus Blackallbacteria) CG18_big_fil_WC_8_21_14_2_50_49_26]PIW14471.1 MAG: Crp/Fnr family transcriptional regulator [bacterium (Candidatus Blackallbacteria) CG17_big_fil_post_rev_8_21_14_2_50_48_46]PIW47157.1 MAG: Crp/Fnr family transcriptional regulator [bacterium (Candidatus Blackallbacteria) CG13_big_fil_rev_8_21_14_2_50_49_14]